VIVADKTDEMEKFAFYLRYPPDVGKERRRPASDRTVALYLYLTRRFLGSLGDEPPTQDAVVSFVRGLERAKSSPRTIALNVYALRAYFAFSGLGDLEVGAPAIPKRLPRWLDDAEWAKLLAEAVRPLANPNLPRRAKERALFHRAALLVYAGGGLRLSEGIGLRKEDVHPRGFLQVIGKGDIESLVPVEDAVIVAVQEWMVTHDSPWVFPGRNGDHLNRRTMQAVIHDLMTDAGIKNIRRCVHMLRHTAGAQLRAAGADIRDIQQLLRHADISTTQIYTQMAEETLRKKLPKRQQLDTRQGRLV
jgi:site-specific recombinase XerD